jgi:organic radical activating enzyme
MKTLIDWNTGNANAQTLGYDTAGGLMVTGIFHTIQGEGPFVGRPAVFVRLSGCNLACSFCDTEYRVAEHQKTLPVDEVVERILDFEEELVVITGGEPFRQASIRQLMDKLSEEGLTVQIETNGTLWPKGPTVLPHRVHVVCSPKTPEIHPAMHDIRPMWKYLIDTSMEIEDGLPVGLARQRHREHQVKVPPKSVWLQGIDVPGRPDEALRNQQRAAELCMTHGFNLSVQIHKILGLP